MIGEKYHTTCGYTLGCLLGFHFSICKESAVFHSVRQLSSSCSGNSVSQKKNRPLDIRAQGRFCLKASRPFSRSVSARVQVEALWLESKLKTGRREETSRQKEDVLVIARAGKVTRILYSLTETKWEVLVGLFVLTTAKPESNAETETETEIETEAHM
jgi:hypothetical protein